jgi:hypothetical protein
MIKYDEALKFLNKWPIWVSFILLIVPGVMYNLDWKNIIISQYPGSLLIVFLISSIYYSIPFFILGFLLALIIGGNRIEWENLLFEASILSILAYATTEILVRLASHAKISIPFWVGFGIISLISTLIFYAFSRSLKIKSRK